MFKNKAAVLGLIIAVGAVIWAFARSFQTGAPLVIDANNPEMTALGQRLYGQHCAVCHGQNLEGQPDWRIKKADGSLPAPPHDESGHTWHHPDAVNFNYVKQGGADDQEANFKTNMPAFKEILSDSEIIAILGFIKSRWPDGVKVKQRRMN